MRKFILFTAIAASFAIASANAANTSQPHPYVGLDLTSTNIGHTNGLSRDDSMGVGVNLGYKIPSDKAFIAPEVFYEYLDTLAVERLGAKVNIGYNFAPKFNGFVNLGVANVGYDDTWPSVSSSYSSSANKMSMIYGFGVSYDLNKDWALKASYDRQRFNVRYTNSSTDRISLNVFKIGVMYNF